ncbi:MAG: helix-turn-helix domain-containing protein, partial [Pseudomonas sp.]|nr:helix-turn-helix domain-containing protein [Pseudomonas sp.]
MAARLAHVLVANMDTTSNAVVASQATIGELMGGVHRNTVRKAIQVLEAERWIEVLQIGGKGGALAYVVNSRVAWGQSREAIRHAAFAARVLVSSSEQTESVDERPPLRQIPVLL